MLEQNLVSFIGYRMREYWNTAAFSNYGHADVYTYGDVARRIKQLHVLLEACGARKGSKIALCGKNSTNWAIAYLATITYGATAVPVLDDFHPQDIMHIVNHSDSILLFASESVYEKLDETRMKGLEGIFSLHDFSPLYTARKKIERAYEETLDFLRDKVDEITADTFFLSRDVKAHDIAAIVYTSGTSGFSKGVMLSYNSLMANNIYARENMLLTPGDRILSFLPLAHAFACSFEFIFPFTRGCHVFFLDKTPSPKILAKAFADIRPRLIFFVPLIFEKIYKNRIAPTLQKTSVKIASRFTLLRRGIYERIRTELTAFLGGNFIEVVVGGAAMNPEVEDFLRKIGFPFTIGYGLTECGPLVSYAPWNKSKTLSVGKPIYFLELRIDSPNPYKIEGEIFVRGENVMSGYYKNNEATRESIDSEGWLHTGDLGLLDKDGYLYIIGRSKNVIVGSSGQNIYPEEIEHLLNVLPFISESLVLESSDGLRALVVPDFEAIDAEKIKSSELEKFLTEKMEHNRNELNKNLPAYSRIARIDLQMEAFEKTPTKKIKRFLYR